MYISNGKFFSIINILYDSQISIPLKATFQQNINFLVEIETKYLQTKQLSGNLERPLGPIIIITIRLRLLGKGWLLVNGWLNFQYAKNDNIGYSVLL